ncbi:MAG: hypothetical protein BWZ09_02661 [Alphaproteobacteria bacterium ADurb.BinA305]|nr:MAG: hypothetical protein BWZ09_02661 [Alphaproteobacteria bacterium ADurb.BinA305]
MASKLCGVTGTLQSGQNCVPSFTYIRRRKGWISVSVATVLLRPPRLVRCSIATVGGMPKRPSTSGRLAGCTNWRA